MKLTLKHPLKDIYINQGFGQNATDLYAKLGLKGHSGIDYRAPDGTPCYSAHDGRVTYAGYDGAGGLTIVIRTEQEFEGIDGKPSFWKTIYCHLKKGTLKVTGGQQVKVGQHIADCDNTGASTGSHLHFGLKPIYKGEEDWQWDNAEQNNGYRGAVDPIPYFDVQYKVFNSVIKQGQRGQDVVTLQAFLVRKGFLVMPPNTSFGYYGQLTADAVKAYQISKHIPHNNGVQVGPLTLRALNEDYDI
jgi:hypothetical protein